MASETGTATATDGAMGGKWFGGALAGVLAGVVMGALLMVTMRPVVEVAIPALVGLSGLPAGWVVHLVNSAIFGLAFAGIASAGPLASYTDSPGTGLAVGVGYGVVVWVVAAALVMPIWLSAVGFPNAPAVPNFNATSLLGHVAFGAVLGAVYPLVE